jgi:proline iminopeptidase
MFAGLAATARSTCRCRARAKLGISPGAKLARRERTDQLSSIEVPTLVIGARHDAMEPAHVEMMAGRLPAGHLHRPSGSHLAMYDDQQAYLAGLIGFLHDRADQRPTSRHG